MHRISDRCTPWPFCQAGSAKWLSARANRRTACRLARSLSRRFWRLLLLWRGSQHDAITSPGRNSPKMPIRGASYARYSTELQNDRSIEDQHRDNRLLAEGDDAEIPAEHEYSDRALSGASVFGRWGLSQLMSDALWQVRAPLCRKPRQNQQKSGGARGHLRRASVSRDRHL